MLTITTVLKVWAWALLIGFLIGVLMNFGGSRTPPESTWAADELERLEAK